MSGKSGTDPITSFPCTDESSTLVLEEQEKYLQSLSHQRHDWMNHFQVLLGYLKLKRYDICEEYIKKVTETTNNESRISQLGYQPLALYLLTFNALHKELKLEVDLPQSLDLKQCPDLNAKQFYSLIRGLIEVYRSHVLDNEGEPNTLVLQLQEVDGTLYVSLDFEGRLDADSCLNSLKQLVKESGWNEEGFFVEGLHNNRESIMEFYVPLSGERGE